MNTNGKAFIACVGAAIIAVGCATPEPVTETVVTKTTRYPDGRVAQSQEVYTDDGSSNGYRRLPNERLYEARVRSVRAVVGQSEERCWVERERVSNNGARVGGAVAGAVIGGILGHQIGSGRGNDVATVGGAVAGGAIGANVAKGRTTERDVKRCEVVANEAAEYYDVTYDFRGVTHRVQMTDPPGRTVTVNDRGEPRV